jgi:hypothetical protein
MSRTPHWWPPETEPDSQWPTSSSFARSLYANDAAFPDAEYASPITRVGASKPARFIDRLFWIIGIVLCVVLIGLLFSFQPGAAP